MHRQAFALFAACMTGIAVFAAMPVVVVYAGSSYQRSEQRVAIPDVTLINQDGKRVKLLNVINSGKPAVVDFIYGTCTTICPVLSAGYANFQRKLGNDARAVQLISISIDPENDSPAVMKKYLKTYQAKPGWDFYSGSRSDIDRVMKAFDAYVPDKMSHYPIMFLRGAGREEWVRIYGLIGTADFIKEYERESTK